MPQLAIGTTPVNVLPRSSGRKTVTLRNVSTGGETIFFWLQDSRGLATTNADYALLVNEEKTFLEYFDGQDMKNPIAAIASGATGVILYGETSEYPGT
jgi:hypothetical protein